MQMWMSLSSALRRHLFWIGTLYEDDHLNQRSISFLNQSETFLSLKLQPLLGQHTLNKTLSYVKLKSRKGVTNLQVYFFLKQADILVYVLFTFCLQSQETHKKNSPQFDAST